MSKNIFIQLSNSTKESSHFDDFEYPLQCSFDVYGYNALSKTYEFIYNRQLSIQYGTLIGGLNLHLNILDWQKHHYRLYLSAKSRERKFKCISSITLTQHGLVDENNPKHLNTFLLEIDD
ncbi:unnamed protein product [Adineta ricciae]|uniref:Uncharacterized protein n=1 Tax=Adineta ricciae TaxID=249248 RepID=A0A815VN93_ADIRI|nr:unnamed protein product [Adineta ricciae]CAF1532664.1 unnamed protein product [Adineta ricciae]